MIRHGAVILVGSLLLVYPLDSPASAQDLLVPVGSTVTISSDSTVASATIQGTLVLDATLTVGGDMLIQSGGVVTHSLRNESGVVLDVGTLNVDSGGLIDVNAKGLRGGHTGSFGVNGESYDPVSGLIVSGAAAGSGGTFGGRGATSSGGAQPNAPYGLLEAATQLGSGGGGANGGNGASFGGHGGGRITITGGDVTIDGTVRANGGSGSADFATGFPGGGSGGSVLIDVVSLSGAGLIQAVGGAGVGPNAGGSGGGGRVAIYTDTNTFPETNVNTRGGNVSRFAAAGTIYVKDNALPTGDLIVDNQNVVTNETTPLRSSLATFKNLLVNQGADLFLVSADIASLSVEEPVVVAGSSSLRLGSGVAMSVTNGTGFDLDVQGTSTLTLDSLSMFSANAVRINNATLNTSIDLSFPTGTDLEVSSAGRINVLNSTTFDVGVFDGTNVQDGLFDLRSGGVLKIASNAMTVANGVTVIKDGAFDDGTGGDQISALTVQSGGVVTHSLRLESGVVLNVGTLNVEAGGLIDVNAKGLRGGHTGSFGVNGESYDPVSGLIVSGAGAGSGGSFGGRGATSSGGAQPNAPYGLLEAAAQLGSGGGGANGGNGASFGGHGGGRITITGGSVAIDGTVRANGGSGSADFATGFPGGGSGGSVLIDVVSLSGAGLIQAVGGAGVGPNAGGSGGGGRVAIYTDTNTLPETNVNTRGGNVSRFAAAGTIYLKDNARPYGDLIVNNQNVVTNESTPLRSSLATFNNLLVDQGADVFLESTDIASLSVEEPVVVSGSSSLRLGSGVAMSVTNADGFDLDIQGSSALTLDSLSTLSANAVRISNATLDTSIDMLFAVGTDLELSVAGRINVLNSTVFDVDVFDGTNVQNGVFDLQGGSVLKVASSAMTVVSGVTVIKDGTFDDGTGADRISALTVQSGGVVTHSLRNESGVVLDVGTLDVQSGGLIDANAKGLRGGHTGSFGVNGESYDPVSGLIVSGAGAGSGGSFGGRGATSSGGAQPNAAYGLLESATQLGSGGGGANGGNGASFGGHGGGRITITGGDVTIDGTVRANGGSGSADFATGFPGGGSGGSVLIDVVGLSGAGLIQAVGGAGVGPNAGGSGGGGRVAIYTDTNTFPETNINTRGGNVSRFAAAGTTYLKDNAQPYGDLIVDNQSVATSETTPLLSSLGTLRNLLVDQGADLFLESADIVSLSVEEPVVVSGSALLRVGGGVAMSVTNGVGFDLDVQGSSVLTLDDLSTLSANAVRISNATLNASVDLSFPVATDLEISGAGRVNVLNSTTFDVGAFDGTNVQNGVFDLRSGSVLKIASNAMTVANGVTLIKEGAFDDGTGGDRIGALTVQSGGVVTHSLRNESGLVLEVATLAVESGGLIDANAKGLRGGHTGSFGVNGESYDPVSGLIVSGAGAGSGGSFGGRGATSSGGAQPNAPYGLLEAATQLGSGGGGANGGNGASFGGHGGGRITITGGDVTIDGTVRANGGSGSANFATGFPGGGSGGSVLIDVVSLSGAGLIQAVGGAGVGPNAGGSGGGGRIAIYTDTNTFPETNINTRGGNVSRFAAAGTIYLKDNAQPYGDLIVNNQNVNSSQSTPWSSELSSISTLRVWAHGRLDVVSEFAVVESLLVSGGGTLLRE